MGASALVPTPIRISRVRRESADVVTLALDASPGGFAFLPGQFNMLYVFGVGEVALSISGSPGSGVEILHTVRVVGPVTQALARLGGGGWVGLRGPFGRPWPLEELRGADLLLVAGGLGLVPLRPALYQLLAERSAYGRIVLCYGTRAPADRIFKRELEQWRRRKDLEVLVTVDRAGRDWQGHVGVVTTLIGQARFDRGQAAALVCGPEVMMRFSARELERQGVADSRIHLSMERNMKCAVGFCGRCQLGPAFICKDGPVLPLPRLRPWLAVREL